MARLIPPDKGTHYVAGSLVALAFLPVGLGLAAAGVALAAVGREAYRAHQLRRPLERADYIEAARDIAFTLGGGAVVLAGAIFH